MRALNADLKQAVTRKAPGPQQTELKRSVISHMRRLSKLPARIRSYFRHDQSATPHDPRQ